MTVLYVMIRQLPQHIPVVSHVYKEEQDEFEFDYSSAAQERLEEHKEKFIKDFPEFKQADWYVSLHTI